MNRDKLGRFIKGINYFPENSFKKGEHPWNYKGLDKLNFICKICGCKISKKSFLYGLRMCKSCSHKKENGFQPRIWTDEHRKNLSEACKGRVSSFKGHHHTEEVKKLMSKERIGIKRPEFCGNNNPAKRPEVQEKMRKPHPSIAGKNHPCFGKTMKPHFIQYKNIWFRSNWEVTLAKELDSKRIKWLYEPKTFDLGNTTYTPDFYLAKTKEYIEVKGYKSEAFENKFKLFKKLYPKIKIKILDEIYFRKE
jgi:hypothetical protein